jgi:hypothetical protein
MSFVRSHNVHSFEWNCEVCLFLSSNLSDRKLQLSHFLFQHQLQCMFESFPSMNKSWKSCVQEQKLQHNRESNWRLYFTYTTYVPFFLYFYSPSFSRHSLKRVRNCWFWTWDFSIEFVFQFNVMNFEIWKRQFVSSSILKNFFVTFLKTN